jgi:acetoin utilization deacetylase AcuC-like enzyme
MLYSFTPGYYYIPTMILHNPHCSIPLTDFGILIPIRYDKQETVYRKLKEVALAGYPETLWAGTPACTGITREDLLRAHSPAYVERLYSAEVEKEAIKTFELIDSTGNYNRYDPSGAKRPLSDLLIRATAVTRGTYECGITALEKGFAFYLGGGMHHAMRDYGSGFCLINDIVIALRKLQAEGRIKTAWVIDLDAHKGDGTAAMTLGDDTIRTLSIHMARGWPLDAPEFDSAGNYNPSHTPSDIDIGIDSGEDRHYVPRLREGLRKLSEYPKPDLVLVVDGSDPYEKDELPSTAGLALSLGSLLERDLLVYDFIENIGIPGAWIMAGGYGAHSWEVYVNFLGIIMPRRLEPAGT